jgi:hypothetical protein
MPRLNRGYRYMFNRHFFSAVGLAGLMSLSPAASMADETLLMIDVAGDGSVIREFTDADLSALPQIEFTTTTIWTTGPVTFSGPSLASVLTAAEVGNGAISMTAVNDYKVEMPRAVVEEGAPIIATRINGEPFSIRENGPLWVVFPFDSGTQYQTEEIYSYSIWQLTRIALVPE